MLCLKCLNWIISDSDSESILKGIMNLALVCKVELNEPNIPESRFYLKTSPVFLQRTKVERRRSTELISFNTIITFSIGIYMKHKFILTSNPIGLEPVHSIMHWN